MRNSQESIGTIVSRFAKTAALGICLITIVSALMLGTGLATHFLSERDLGIIEGNRSYLEQLLVNNETIELSRQLNSYIEAKTFEGFFIKNISNNQTIATGGFTIGEDSKLVQLFRFKNFFDYKKWRISSKKNCAFKWTI